MRKQTKLVAVLSAAALLAVGASMTSFAAGWTEENGTWVYYDSDDELVTNEWKKSGSNYYYLNDDGEMATETWVEDEYYVDESGKMVTNSWQKLTLDDADIDDPDGDGEGWFWFDSKGKKVTDMKKTINGKVYFFDGDGVMQHGWYEDEGNIYYLGKEDDGARKSGWLWLEQENSDDVELCDEDDDICDEEGWYWFAKDGKMFKGGGQKKIDGKYYYFNEHGQMLYNWIVLASESDAPNVKDNEDINDSEKAGEIGDLRYAFNTDKGWRVDGWLKLDGSYSLGHDEDEDWYFFKKGEAKNANDNEKYADVVNLLNEQGNYGLKNSRTRAKIKVEGKYFCFDQDGRMKTGLQAIAEDITDGTASSYEVYYFDENGNMKTGKVNNVELDNGDTKTFYFQTSNAKKGQGVTGEESGYLYYKGMRLEADDDYAFYTLGSDKIYLVNKSGKIQKPSTSGKKIDPEKIENDDYDIVNISGADDNDKINVFIVGNSKTGVITDITAGTDAKKAESIKSELENSEDFFKVAEKADFGWED